MRKIPEEYYRQWAECYIEFSFDSEYLSRNNRVAMGSLIRDYYPEFQGTGTLIPFTEIAELRQFGEELIRMQNSPLWKALT